MAYLCGGAIVTKDNLGCLEFELTDQQLQQLAGANPLDPGYPNYFLAQPHLVDLIYSGMFEQIDSHHAGLQIAD